MLAKVISGGQTGADQAGWLAAKASGIPTGGWMPKGFLTELGPRPEFAQLFGARESSSADYPSRTRQNVGTADALIWFGNPHSPGGKLTLRLANEASLDQMVIVTGARTKPDEVSDWVLRGTASDEVRVLMVAGNRESSSPGIGAFSEAFLRDVFCALARSKGPTCPMCDGPGVATRSKAIWSCASCGIEFKR